MASILNVQVWADEGDLRPHTPKPSARSAQVEISQKDGQQLFTRSIDRSADVDPSIRDRPPCAQSGPRRQREQAARGWGCRSDLAGRCSSQASAPHGAQGRPVVGALRPMRGSEAPAIPAPRLACSRSAERSAMRYRLLVTSIEPRLGGRGRARTDARPRPTRCAVAWRGRG